jgi:hypothetical protein
MLRATENDPRERKFPLTLSRGQGNVVLIVSAIESVSKDGLTELKVNIRGHMSLYVKAEPGLYASLHRAMADCDDAQDLADTKADEAIS